MPATAESGSSGEAAASSCGCGSSDSSTRPVTGDHQQPSAGAHLHSSMTMWMLESSS